MIDLEAVVDSLPQQIAVVDRDGVIVHVNEAWRTFALQNEATMDRVGPGADYLEVCASARGGDSDGADDVAAAIRRVLLGVQRSYVTEYPCHAPDRLRWFRMTVTPVGPDGDRPDGAVVAHLEITDRRLAEEETRVSNRRLAESYADLEAFAIEVVHDLTEPLRTLGLSVQALMRITEFDEQGTELVDDIESGLIRLQRTVSGLRRMTETQQATTMFEIVDTTALVDDVLGELGALITDRDATVEVGPLPQIVGSRDLLRRLFSNTISNAVRHGGDDGVHVRIRSQSDATGHIIRIDDDGEGIPADDRERAFRPLWRGRRQRGTEGSGMGLALCRHAVTRHGGSIWLEDSPLGGLTVAVYLPRQIGGVPTQATPQREPTPVT